MGRGLGVRAGLGVGVGLGVEVGVAVAVAVAVAVGVAVAVAVGVAVGVGLGVPMIVFAGNEGIPFATTTRSLAPGSTLAGTSNCVVTISLLPTASTPILLWL